MNSRLPDFLSHYYESAAGPLKNLSDLSPGEAEAIQQRIRLDGNRFASRRAADYLSIRRELEERIRDLFIAKGGCPRRARPHYFILGACEWVKTWYVEGCELRISLSAFDLSAVSFTYGDSFPAMRYQDGKPYRGQVYTWEELPGLVDQYSLPQEWNADGKGGPDRYIEAQVWEDEVIKNLYGMPGLSNRPGIP